MKRTSEERQENTEVIKLEKPNEEVLESELGNIRVSREHFERDRSDSDRWRNIKNHFSAENIIDKLHFSEIDSIELRVDTMYPYIEIDLGTSDGKVFFYEEDVAEEFFKLLRYRRNAWRQNYQS